MRNLLRRVRNNIGRGARAAANFIRNRVGPGRGRTSNS